MISIYLNNKVQQIEPIQQLDEFLMNNDFTQQHFAVAINDQLVPRTAWRSTRLNQDDRVDIIVPMQGG